MSQRPEDILKVSSKSEDLLDMIERGRAFTLELMGENERLRYRMVQLEAERVSAEEIHRREVAKLQLEADLARQRLEFLDSRFHEIEEENKDFAQRYVEVEEQNESLANLYVASYNLHSTLDPQEVIGCIKEILLNLIGAEEFALYVMDEETGDLSLASYEGDPLSALHADRIAPGEGLEGMVAASGEAFFALDTGDSGEVCACFPLKLKEQVVGVIAIYKLLAHKPLLTELDHRLLELLAGHAATALVSSKLYAQTDRKLKTWEGVMSLLRES
ncbi:MAG TPA: GAF domain-containing protein [Blastocatellia bacterium]|nr:GAF domain-containing protein [Blastocatellia bacterium]